MKLTRNPEGQKVLTHPVYVSNTNAVARLASTTTIAAERLWIGDAHLLTRDEVRQLVLHLEHWVLTGSLGNVDA